jgi:hypothetical protein
MSSNKTSMETLPQSLIPETDHIPKRNNRIENREPDPLQSTIVATDKENVHTESGSGTPPVEIEVVSQLSPPDTQSVDVVDGVADIQIDNNQLEDSPVEEVIVILNPGDQGKSLRELRQICADKNLNDKGKKNELVQRIQESEAKSIS